MIRRSNIIDDCQLERSLSQTVFSQILLCLFIILKTQIASSYYPVLSHNLSFMSDHSCICLAGSSYPPLGKGYYDAIVFGLGFRECLLACLLLKEGKKVFKTTSFHE